jgi:uracil-DNA glycosylase family 4
MSQSGYLFAPDALNTRGCSKCPLNKSRIVENIAVNQSPLMFVGEAPGDVETRLGEPFCGPAGEELDRHLRVCNIPREKVSIGNIVRCQPKSGNTNREPTKLEIQCCSLYLDAFIEESKPKVIVALGNSAFNALIGPQKVGITKLRGRVFWYQNRRIYVIATFHPSQDKKDKRFTLARSIFEFQSDLNRAKQLCTQPFEDHRKQVVIVNSEKQALIALSAIERQRCTAVDIEGFRPDNLLTLSFSGQAGTSAVVVPVNHRESKLTKNGQLFPSIFKKIQKILKSLEIIGQNFNDLDRTVLENYFKVTVRKVYRDTMYASYIDDARNRGLEQWASLQGMSRNEAMANCDQMPLALLGLHNGLDVIATHLSCDALWEKFNNKQKRLTKVLTEASRATQEMEDTGIRFDMPYSQKLSREYDHLLADIRNQIQGMVGDRNFNPAAPNQVADYIFDIKKYHEGIPFSSREQNFLKSKTGRYSSKEEILSRISQETENEEAREFVDTVLNFRDKSKDQNTFITSLQERVGVDKRIHVPIILHGSETGRAACTLHNVKKTQKEINGEKRYILLDQFIATPGYKLVRGDFKQIELRMAAEISQDQAFLDVFKTGRDPHHETAEFIFQLDDGVRETSQQRTIAKNANFGSLFGLSETELHDYLKTKIPGFNLPVDEVVEFHRSFYRKYQTFRAWQKATIKFAKKYGFVEGLFGRRRRLNPDQKKHFYNQAVNTPIQGSAHDLLLLAMIQLFHLPDRDFHMLLDHHDALWLEVPEDTLFPNLKRIKDAMEHLDTERWYKTKLSIPTPIDLEMGTSMGCMKSVDLEL